MPSRLCARKPAGGSNVTDDCTHGACGCLGGARIVCPRAKVCVGWVDTRACNVLSKPSSTGAGATVTRRLAALVGPCSSSPREKPRSCPKPSESKARCCCAKSRPMTSRTQVPKFIGSPPSHNRAHERARHAAWQPLRPLPASNLRQVQAAAREKRRSDLRDPVRLPSLLQQQEFQVRLGTARLARACRRPAARGGESGEGGGPLSDGAPPTTVSSISGNARTCIEGALQDPL